MPNEWREVLGRRNRTSKTKRLYEDDQPTNKYSWDGMVGTSLHYEEAGEWLEVDPRIVPSDEPGWDWEMRKSHWRFLVRNGGWFAAEKQGVGIGFRLERVAYLNIDTKEWETIRTANYSTPTVEVIEHGNELLANPLGKLTWANLFPGVDFEIHVSGDRLHEEIKVSQAARDAMPALPYPANQTYLVMVYQVDWGQVPGLADDDGDINYNQDFERTARLYLKNQQGEIITALPASRAWPESEPVDEDGEAIQVPLRKRFIKVAGQHYLLVGAPVVALNALPEGTIIFDPDLDESVAATDDDASSKVSDHSYWQLNYDYLMGGKFGQSTYSSGMRFLTVNVPQGATIDVAHLTLTSRASYSVDTVYTNLSAEAIDEAAIFTTAANYWARSRTASISWDNLSAWVQWSEYESSSIVTPIQAVINRDGWAANNDLVIFWDDDGSGSNARRHGCQYDYGPGTYPAKLHIEYSAGDVTVDAVVATATAAGLVSTVTGDGLVSGQLAAATAAGLVPTVSGGTGTTVSAVLATASAAALVPTVTGGTGTTVSAVIATATAVGLVPTVTGDALVAGVLATAPAAALVPTVSGGTGATVSAMLATAAAAGLVPVVTGGALVSGELATATAMALIPVVSGEGEVQVDAVTATAVAAALLPTITGDALVTAVLATAAAAALIPTVTGGTGATVSGVLATAAAAGLVATITGNAIVSAELAEAVAAALVPTITGGATVSAEIATAIAEALIPVITGEGAIDVTVYATVAEALAAALVPIVTSGIGTTISAVVATALAEALVPRILTLWIALTLQTRSTSLTLNSRSLDLTLPTRSLDLTLREKND